eukprot:CAMPEP_0176184920 /NCGR_PEP_ID=MMETSP0121_2-20121125/1075_1 /TAXON_ID=160619 /ORGANISM="Kryptoperidinium foliaceum, Strain CCMP 1326" /LENGTH=125 /DNA_ID=CAMNT_0017523333 /DNA_START=9 /DNA_END=383 /DNA_ORIENTATION=+
MVGAKQQTSKVTSRSHECSMDDSWLARSMAWPYLRGKRDMCKSAKRAMPLAIPCLLATITAIAPARNAVMLRRTRNGMAAPAGQRKSHYQQADLHRGSQAKSFNSAANTPLGLLAFDFGCEPRHV